MVLLALGVIAVSLSFLSYNYRMTLLSRFYKSEKPESDKTPSISESRSPETEEEDDLTTGKTSDVEIRLQPDFEQNGSPPDTSEAGSRIQRPMDKSDSLKTQNRSGSAGPTTSLMPPPPRPTSKSLAPPKLPTSLRHPPSSASSLRVPPGQAPRGNNTSLAPSTSTLAPSARPSRKVLLAPGRSPLDWAALTANPPTPTFLRGADMPPSLIRVPPSLLKYHNGRKDKTGKRKDAWGVYQGKVYNMTPYMEYHPGGTDQLMRGAGKESEAEKLFNETHPWVSWENMLGECLVGVLVSENEVNGGMDDMD